jgi:hypothetical protein
MNVIHVTIGRGGRNKYKTGQGQELEGTRTQERQKQSNGLHELIPSPGQLRHSGR